MICMKATHLTKCYGEKVAVNDLSFEVKEGEIYGLLGPNGAGKSTTIDCLLGLTKMNQGQRTVLGMDPVKQRKELYQKVGVQLQTTGYQKTMKVGELCEETSSFYKKANDYHELLIQFHLDDKVNQSIESLSGGERQKLFIVLTLVMNPKLVFLDELTTGLDVEARREVWNEIKRLKEKGITVFLTSHYMDEVEYLCDRVCLIRDGEKVTEGTVHELLANSPFDKFEDAYLWYMEGEKRA